MFTLVPRPRSADFDIVGGNGAALGRVVKSVNGYTTYVFGDVEQLFPPHTTAEEALTAFEQWTMHNTLTGIPTFPPAR